MIIVDTGSSDGTIEIAKKYGAKILNYEWDQNFSNARNFSIQSAVSDWILLMDGDDVLEKDDVEKFIQVVNQSQMEGHYFRTLSYVGSEPGKDVVLNLNLRLLRNNKKYKYIYPIHEQLTCLEGQMDYSKFPTEDIRVHHYGYLNTVAVEKNKRVRNISIIQEELQKNPNNNFQCFNLANEYYALGQLDKAIDLFNQVYHKMDPREGYAVKLTIRRVMCFDELGRYEQALAAIEEGLNKYSNFTDLIFVRGCIYLKLRRYTLALDSFERCIELGVPPVYLEYLNGCGTYRPFHAMGEIYFILEDYDKAIFCFDKALSFDRNLTDPLFKIAAIFNKTIKNKRLVSFKLSQYFDLQNPKELCIIAQILIKEGLYDIAWGYLEKSKDLDEYNNETNYHLARVLFYQKQYSKASEIFTFLLEKTDLKEKSARYLFVIGVLTANSDQLSAIINKLKEAVNEFEYKTYLQFLNIILKKEEIVFKADDNHERLLQVAIDVLGNLLKVKNFTLFETLLEILNSIESKKVLLELAHLYNNNGFGQLAVQEVIRSIKEFNAVDREGIEILYHQLC